MFRKLKNMLKKSSPEEKHELPGEEKPGAPPSAVAAVSSLAQESQKGGAPAEPRRAVRTTQMLRMDLFEGTAKISREDIQLAMKANNDAVPLKKQGNVQESLALYQKALILYPQYAIAYYNRALLYTEQGEDDKALADYTKAIEFNSRDPDFYNNRGNIYGRHENFEKALEDYDQAIALSPNNSESYHNRARLYAKLNQLDMAIKDLKRAIELNPDLVVDYFNLTCLYTLKGETDLAFEFLEKAFRKGYKNIAWVRRDPDLASLKENPAFEDLLDMWDNKSKD